MQDSTAGPIARIAPIPKCIQSQKDALMAVYYELKTIGETKSGKPTADLVKITKEESVKTEEALVEAIPSEEFVKLDIPMPNLKESFKTLHDSESNFIDVYAEYIVGSFYIPHKTITHELPARFGFYMDKNRLIFVENGKQAEKILNSISQSGVISDITPAHCLHVFIKDLLMHDFLNLGKLEDQMEQVEEKMMDAGKEIPTNLITHYRRHCMQLSVFYQQIAGMTSDLAENENKLMSDYDANSFDHLSSIADRLVSRADVLKEYSMQLQELQQTQIDLKQNSIMQVFTIVTVLFAPLTLITGWFGMNLQTIPGLGWPFMWITLIAIALVSTVVLLLLFHKRKWL